MKNYYTTLGVSQDASFLDIRKAYLTLSKKIHPDKNDDSGATEKFKALNEAYEVLSDPEKRKTFQNQFSQMQKQQEFQRKQYFQRQSEFQRQQWDKFEQRVIHIQKQQELERQWELRRQQEIKRKQQQELIRQKEMKWQQELERNQEIQRQKLQKQQFLHMKKQMQRQQELKNQLELKRQQEMQEMQNNFSKIAIDESIQEAFMEAAKTGNLDACKYMIEKVKNVCDSANEEKTTALHYAAENGHLQVRQS